MRNTDPKRNFLMRYGISITLFFIIIMIIVISKIISIDQEINIDIAKINMTSYIGIIQLPIDRKQVIYQDSIVLGIENELIEFKIDSVSEHSNILYLSKKSQDKLPDVFSAKFKDGNKMLWDIIFIHQ